MRRVERREGGWYVVEGEPGIDGYSTVSNASRRRRVPIAADAPRDLAELVARCAGMMDEDDMEGKR